jgi:hypothetical protein
MTSRAEREKEAAARRKQPFVLQGVDLQAEICKMMKQLELTRNVDALGRKLKKPVIKIRHSATKTQYSGRGGKFRVVVTLGRNIMVAQALEVLLHELCHTAMARRGRNDSHSDSFTALVVRSACDLWGLEALDWRNIERGNHNCRAYAVDHEIMKQLQQRIDDGLYVPAQAEASPTAPSRAERAERRKAEREAHARRMFELHQKKLTREQKLVRKWKQKVTYYEKQAAKRQEKI